jgi:hypothetical protein
VGGLEAQTNSAGKKHAVEVAIDNYGKKVPETWHRQTATLYMSIDFDSIEIEDAMDSDGDLFLLMYIAEVRGGNITNSSVALMTSKEDKMIKWVIDGVDVLESLGFEYDRSKSGFRSGGDAYIKGDLIVVNAKQNNADFWAWGFACVDWKEFGL